MYEQSQYERAFHLIIEIDKAKRKKFPFVSKGVERKSRKKAQALQRELSQLPKTAVRHASESINTEAFNCQLKRV